MMLSAHDNEVKFISSSGNSWHLAEISLVAGYSRLADEAEDSDQFCLLEDVTSGLCINGTLSTVTDWDIVQGHSLKPSL